MSGTKGIELDDLLLVVGVFAAGRQRRRPCRVLEERLADTQADLGAGRERADAAVLLHDLERQVRSRRSRVSGSAASEGKQSGRPWKGPLLERLLALQRRVSRFWGGDGSFSWRSKLERPPRLTWRRRRVGSSLLNPFRIHAEQEEPMRARTISGQPNRVHVVVLEKGEEVNASLLAFARDADLRSAHFTAIGALSEIVLGFFDRDRKAYDEIPIREQVEVLALTGNFTEERGEHRLHAHAVVGKRDGSAHGGHLLRAEVFPTLEVIVTEVAAELRRTVDPETGIALISQVVRT
jgi:predicted DNA-binding protein with PD1-like motif